MFQYITKALIALTCLILGSTANAQQTPPPAEWFTSHNGSREESHGHYILECADGGFLQIGETGFVGSNARILVVKTGPNGGLDWEATYSGGPGGDCAAEDIDLTRDGGAIVAVDNGRFGFLKLATFLQTGTLDGDLNGDGCITGQDLAIILANWGAIDNPADLNGDGVVGGQDLAFVLSKWNECL